MAGHVAYEEALQNVDEPKKCWICFGDSTEDAPGSTSSWRSPCPCALTAHESCLLDWIADLEASPSNSHHRPRKDKIECPQCKAEIRVARPWSPVVASVRAIERAAGASVVPGIVSILLGGVTSACFVHGATSVFLILGSKDWEKLIGSTNGQVTRGGLALIAGLPMVPVALVLSRTKIADGLFPILPILLLGPRVATVMGRWNKLDGRIGVYQPMRLGSPETAYGATQLWPPTIAWTFAALPYVRAAYNAGYAKLFAERKKEWERAVQREPRPGETEEQVIQGQAAQERGNIEIQAEIVFGDDVNEEHDPIEAEAAFDAVVGRAGNPGDQAEIAPMGGLNGEIQRGQGQHVNAPNQRRLLGRNQDNNNGNDNNDNNNNNGLIMSASKVADTILGALCFPAIAALMGELLKLSLPAKMTAEMQTRRPGLLHEKWGRSVVGGCLFVVVKDALVLYSRYRLAHDHKKRRILDYNGPRPHSMSS